MARVTNRQSQGTNLSDYYKLRTMRDREARYGAAHEMQMRIAQLEYDKAQREVQDEMAFRDFQSKMVSGAMGEFGAAGPQTGGHSVGTPAGPPAPEAGVGAAGPVMGMPRWAQKAMPRQQDKQMFMASLNRISDPQMRQMLIDWWEREQTENIQRASMQDALDDIKDALAQGVIDENQAEQMTADLQDELALNDLDPDSVRKLLSGQRDYMAGQATIEQYKLESIQRMDQMIEDSKQRGASLEERSAATRARTKAELEYGRALANATPEEAAQLMRQAEAQVEVALNPELAVAAEVRWEYEMKARAAQQAHLNSMQEMFAKLEAGALDDEERARIAAVRTDYLGGLGVGGQMSGQQVLETLRTMEPGTPEYDRFIIENQETLMNMGAQEVAPEMGDLLGGETVPTEHLGEKTAKDVAGAWEYATDPLKDEDRLNLKQAFNRGNVDEVVKELTEAGKRVSAQDLDRARSESNFGRAEAIVSQENREELFEAAEDFLDMPKLRARKWADAHKEQIIQAARELGLPAAADAKARPGAMPIMGGGAPPKGKYPTHFSGVLPDEAWRDIFKRAQELAKGPLEGPTTEPVFTEPEMPPNAWTDRKTIHN